MFFSIDDEFCAVPIVTVQLSPGEGLQRQGRSVLACGVSKLDPAVKAH